MSRIYQVEQPDNTSVLHDIGFERSISIINGYTGASALHQYALCAFDTGTNPLISNMVPFTTSGGLNQKSPNSSVYFPIGCQIYYHPDATAFAATHSFDSKLFYRAFEAVDARYTSTTGNPSMSLNNIFSSVYLRISVTTDFARWSVYDSGNPNNVAEIIVTSDSLVEGNYYIYLGRKSVNDTYTFQLEDNHPMYYYDGKSMIEFGVYVASQGGGGGGA